MAIIAKGCKFSVKLTTQSTGGFKRTLKNLSGSAHWFSGVIGTLAISLIALVVLCNAYQIDLKEAATAEKVTSTRIRARTHSSPLSFPRGDSWQTI